MGGRGRGGCGSRRHRTLPHVIQPDEPACPALFPLQSADTAVGTAVETAHLVELPAAAEPGTATFRDAAGGVEIPADLAIAANNVLAIFCSAKKECLHIGRWNL